MNIKTEPKGNEFSASIFSYAPGLLIAGVILFFALVKLDFNLALVAAGVLIVSFTAELWVRLASARINFAMRPDRERLFPDETLVLELELDNDKFLPVWVNLELPTPKHLESAESFTRGTTGENVLQTGLRLLSWERSSRPWRLTAKRRGVSRLGPALISAGDLLGLGTRTKSWASPREIIVFPRRLQMLPLDLPFQEYFGMHTARGPVDDPAWYAGTREYSGTRPAKNIHWKASARLGVLQEKLFEPTYHRKVLFIFDTESYTAPPPQEEGVVCDPSAWRQKAECDFERMLETLGTLAAALMETSASFGLVTCVPDPQWAKELKTSILSAARGPEQLGLFLETLARLELPPISDSETTLQRSRRLTAALAEASRHYTGLVYCGACPGEGAKDAVRETGERKKILYVFSRDAEPYFENQPACLARDVCFAQEDAK